MMKLQMGGRVHAKLGMFAGQRQKQSKLLRCLVTKV